MRIMGKGRSLVVGMVAMLAVGSLAACGGEAAGKSNADLLKEAATNMKAAKSYHLDADITQDTTAVKMNGDIDVATKNMMLGMDADGQKVDMIMADGKLYMSMDEGANYTEGDASMASGFDSFTNMWDSFKPEEVDKAKDALKDGTPATETIDGVATKHITANAKDLAILGSSGGTSTTDGTIELWISTDAKPYIRQMRIDGTSEGKPIKGLLKWSKFDEKFDIKAPPTGMIPGSPASAATK